MSEKWTNPAARKTKMLLLIGPSTGMTAGVAGVLTGLMTDLEILTLMLAAAGVAGQVIPALAVADPLGTDEVGSRPSRYPEDWVRPSWEGRRNGPTSEWAGPSWWGPCAWRPHG